MLRSFARMVQALARYVDRMSEDLDLVDEGKSEFVSGAKVSSYHTVWFELHEDLLRMLDRTRDE